MKELLKRRCLAVAQVAGIMAAKNTSHMIPMCHPIMITGCDISFNLDFENSKIDIKAVVKTVGQTGVEMEALTAVTVAALTIYDMCKAIDRDMVISEIMLVKKVVENQAFMKGRFNNGKGGVS